MVSTWLRGLFTWLNAKQKGKDLGTLWGGMIRNMMYLRLQRGRSKLTNFLLQNRI